MASSGSKRENTPGPKREGPKIARDGQNDLDTKMGDIVFELIGKRWNEKTAYERRTRFADNALKNLNNPKFLLERVESLQKKLEDGTTSGNVQSILLKGNGAMTEITAEASQIAKEQKSQSMNEELNQFQEKANNLDQSMKVDMNGYFIKPKKLQEVMNSWLATQANKILNSPIPASQIFKETLLPMSDEEFNQQTQMMTQYLSSQDKRQSLNFAPAQDSGLEKLDFSFPEDDTFDFPSDILDDKVTVKTYKVSESNASVVSTILEKYPNTVENLVIKNTKIQSFFMNLLAGLYQEIIDKKERLERKGSTNEDMDLDEILSIIGDDNLNWQSKINDLEYNGFQVSWLKEIATEIEDAKEWLKAHIAITKNQRKVQQEADQHEQQRPNFLMKGQT